MIKVVKGSLGFYVLQSVNYPSPHPSEEDALVEAEKLCRTQLDEIQSELTTARQRVKAAGSQSY